MSNPKVETVKKGWHFTGRKSEKEVVVSECSEDVVTYFYDIYPVDMKGTERTFDLPVEEFLKSYKRKCHEVKDVS